MAGCEQGEVAIVDLQASGVVQRIPAPAEHCKAQQLLFASATCLLVLYTFRSGSSRLQRFTPSAAGEAIQWTPSDRRDFKGRTVCRMCVW